MRFPLAGGVVGCVGLMAMLGVSLGVSGVEAHAVVVARAVWAPPDGVEIGWSATAGRSYRLESVGDLSEAWSPHVTDPAVLVASGDSPAVTVPMDGGRRFFRVVELAEQEAPPGMVLIPGGPFVMGDTIGDGWDYERPTRTVEVSAFYMDRTEVTKAEWDEVYGWAVANGYELDNRGSWSDWGGDISKGPNHPVHSVNWYDVVKWCNARSEKQGRVPAYYTGADRTTVYRTGRVDVRNEWVRWDGGYRLPTEAEWEKAARGGLEGRRFPWGDTISHSQANYWSYWVGGRPYYSYDMSATEGYHPTCATGGAPYTSPVGTFAANGYGLYDMAGNVFEWCWDWYDSSYFGTAPAVDPRGPAVGSGRVIRGGCWISNAWICRVTSRDFNGTDGWDSALAFRSVLPPGRREAGQNDGRNDLEQVGGVWGWTEPFVLPDPGRGS